MGAWRIGFNVPAGWAAVAPVAALVFAGTGVALGSGDIREGVFPWAMALAASSLAVCCLGVLAAHGHRARAWIVIGSWWTAAAMIGIAGFFVAIAIGGLAGIEEDEVGLLGWLPVISMAFGIISMTPALSVLGIGVTRAGLLRGGQRLPYGWQRRPCPCCSSPAAWPREPQKTSASSACSAPSLLHGWCSERRCRKPPAGPDISPRKQLPAPPAGESA